MLRRREAGMGAMADNWQIRFYQRTSDFGGSVFSSIIFLGGFGTFFLLFGFYELFTGSGWKSVTSFLGAGLCFFFSFYFKPWHPTTISKTDDSLRIKIKWWDAHLMTRTIIMHLPNLKSWYYSDPDKLLKLRISRTSSRATMPGLTRLSLKGMKPADLSFLLGWLGRNYKRAPSLEKK